MIVRCFFSCMFLQNVVVRRWGGLHTILACRPEAHMEWTLPWYDLVFSRQGLRAQGLLVSQLGTHELPQWDAWFQRRWCLSRRYGHLLSICFRSRLQPGLVNLAALKSSSLVSTQGAP